MEDLVQVITYVNNVLYVTLAIAAFRGWRRRGGASAAWVAATFGTLAAIGIIGLVTDDDAEGTVADILTAITLFGVVFFAYGLYRFTASLRGPSPVMDKLALGLSVAVALFTLFLGDLPEPGEPRTTKIQIYILLLLLQWGGLLVTVAIRLWSAGKGQPTLARRRMRLLSLGSIGLTLLLVVAAAETGEREASVEVVTGLMGTLSVLCFFLGFAPPGLLRIAWRRPEQEALRDATERLVSATSEDEVTGTLLPHVTRTLGARAAMLVAPNGDIIGAHGDLPDGTGLRGPEPRGPAQEKVEATLLRLEFEFGSLVIWASPYTPFFGQEEVELLRTFGILTGLALDRTKLFRSEQEARASAEDTSARLQVANHGLEESRARLAEAQSIAHIGSFEWDARTDEVAWSDEMFAIFGVDPGTQVTYAWYFELLHEEDRDFVDSVIKNAMVERQPYSFDHRIVRPDGVIRVLHARGKVETDENGETLRVVGTAQDVTAAREAERRIATALSSERSARRSLEELNEEMESFVYTVSHDLNSPIIAIQGFSEFLAKDFGELLPEKGRFYLERIGASAGYLQSLIKDLLAFSRVGRAQTETEEISLQELVIQTKDEVKANCPGLEVEAKDLPSVRMNPLRARQLFTNLMQNSCRYAGRPDVRVSVEASMTDADQVSISIKDNGPGIPAEHRKRVFAVFERLQVAGPTDGTGMGLPICKKIVESIGGRMWIADSSAGLDLRFTLPALSSSVDLDEERAS